MADLIIRCEVCGALIDEEDLFCANCGVPAPDKEEQSASVAADDARYRFVCQGCGASMSYDARAGSLRCPFCGSQRIEEEPGGKSLSAHRVIPFSVSRDDAVARLRSWLGRGFWRPGDLARAALVTDITPVYVPYWVFEAETFTYWTGDTSNTPFGARGDWSPMFGDHRGRHSGLLVGASSALTPNETAAICPFDLSQAKPRGEVDLRDSAVEQFRVPRKYARPQARQGLEAAELEACQAYIPGRSRNLKVNVRLEGLASEPVLLPVWIMAYRYHDKLFRFLINGQTGKATGQAPMSYWKIATPLAIAALVGLVMLILSLVLGG